MDAGEEVGDEEVDAPLVLDRPRHPLRYLDLVTLAKQQSTLVQIGWEAQVVRRQSPMRKSL